MSEEKKTGEKKHHRCAHCEGDQAIQKRRAAFADVYDAVRRA